jgi:hypothetical protein
MDDSTRSDSYSAEVNLWLDCGAHGTVPLTHAAPTFVIAAIEASFPECMARVIVSIDGRRSERSVQLVNGMSPPNREAMILSHDGISPS